MSGPAKILIVEDEEHLAEGIAFNLKKLSVNSAILS